MRIFPSNYPHLSALACGIVMTAVICGPAWSQNSTALTTIQDTLFRADGARFTGTLTIHWNTFDSASPGTVVQQSKLVSVSNGNLQVKLVPNAGTPAPLNIYTVSYQSSGVEQFTELWTVPPSESPLKVADVRTGMLVSSSTMQQASNSTPIVESSVVGLLNDLSMRPIKGPGFGTGAVAVINQNGQVETAVGNIGDCLYVGGTTGPCGGPASSFVDAEMPAGLVDGANDTFTLTNPPSGASLLLFRNGMYMKAGFDYNLTGSSIQFVAGAVPQPLDTLVASYRLDSDSTLANLSLPPGRSSVMAQVLCSAGGGSSRTSDFSSLGACEIPAANLKPGDRIEVRFSWAHTGTSSGFDVQIRWGDTSMVARHGSIQDSAFAGQAEASVTAGGAQITSQSWGTILPFLPGIVNAASSDGVRIDLQGKLTFAGGDSLTLTNFTVLRYPAH
jgi:hypothetical protein